MMRFRTLVVALSATLAIGSGYSVAQQTENSERIEIVNKDGESTRIEIIAPGQANAQVQIQGNASGGAAGGQIAGGAGISIKNGDGKIIVVDKDGETREIDVSNARSIIVNQGVKSIMVDGEEKRESFGKAIVIGPDGVRQEFDLAPGTNQGGVMIHGGLPGGGLPGIHWNHFEAKPVEASFMIGVNCQPISEALGAQLQLDGGLIVENVSSDGPAALAGIQKHDILMYVDEKQMNSIEELSAMVQSAGKEKSSLSVSLIRGGKEKTVEVSPVERPAQARVFGLGGPMQFQFRQLGPGGLMQIPMGTPLQNGLHQDFEAQMKEMREQMKRMREEMDRQFRSAPGARTKNADDF